MAKTTPIETLLEWLGKNYYYIGNDLLKKVEKLKQMEKLQNHSEYMRGWYNGFNSKEIETKGLEKTAVEWLCSQIYTIQAELEAGNNCLKMKIKQAKEMEKQQMKKAQMHYSSDVLGFKTLLEKQFENWYNETFKTK